MAEDGAEPGVEGPEQDVLDGELALVADIELAEALSSADGGPAGGAEAGGLEAEGFA